MSVRVELERWWTFQFGVQHASDLRPTIVHSHIPEFYCRFPPSAGLKLHTWNDEAGSDRISTADFHLPEEYRPGWDYFNKIQFHDNCALAFQPSRPLSASVLKESFIQP